MPTEVAEPAKTEKPPQTNPPNNEPPKSDDDATAKFPSIAEAWKEAQKRHIYKAPEEPAKEESKEEVKTEPPKDEKPVETKSVVDSILDEPKVEKETEKPDDLVAEFKDVKKPTSEHWSKAREGIQKRDATIAELNQKLKAVPTEPVIPEDVKAKLDTFEKIKEENDRLKDSITAINVRYGDEYQKLEAQASKEINRAVRRVNQFGGDGEAFRYALTMPEGKPRNEMIKAALAEIEPTDRPNVNDVMDKVGDLQEQMAELEKDPQQALERLTNARQVQQQKVIEETQRINNAKYEQKLRELSDAFYLLRTAPADRNGAKEWNAEVEKENAEAKRLLFSPGVTFEEYAHTIRLGVAAKRYQEYWLSERKAKEDALKEVGEIDKSQPDVKGTKAPPSTEDETDLTIGQRYQKLQEQRKQSAVDY